jgi:hypothetical protein
VTIFISYSSLDRRRAEELQAMLEFAGVVVWRDRTRLEVDWSREIASALAHADAVLLLWSNAAAQSDWVRHEWLTARGLEKRIFPCLLDDAPALPLPICTLDALPWSERNELLRRIQSTCTFHHVYDYTTLPGKAYLPFNPDPQFTGREEELLELYLDMVGNLNNIGTNYTGLVGMGGVGKSALAAEFAWRFSFAFVDIFWVQAANEKTWETQFVEIARDYLGLSIARSESEGNSRQYLVALQRHCKQQSRTLIIMDNVSDPARLNQDVLNGIAPLAIGCNVLFTTRRRFSLPGVIERTLESLSKEGAYSVLTTNYPPTPEDTSSVISICDIVGRLPLALVIINRFLVKRRLLYSDYRSKLTQRGFDAIDIGVVSREQLATRHAAAVEATIAEQWQQVESDIARTLFGALSLFPETEIVEKARIGVCVGLEETDELLDPLADGLSELIDLHLVEDRKGGRAVQLHPIIHQFALRLVSLEERSALKVDVAGNVARMYGDASSLARQREKRGLEAVLDDLALAAVFLPWQPTDETSKINHRLRELAREMSTRHEDQAPERPPVLPADATDEQKTIYRLQEAMRRENELFKLSQRPDFDRRKTKWIISWVK